MDISAFQNLAKDRGVEYRIWGPSGSQFASHLSACLKTQLADEFREFVENFGNLSINPFLIAVTGDEEGRMNAVSSTELLRQDGVNIPLGSLRIMEHAGESYLLDLSSGEVAAFDSLNINPAATTLEFSSFDDFLRWVVNEAADQLHSSDFKF